jgi:hypothetical protein
MEVTFAVVSFLLAKDIKCDDLPVDNGEGGGMLCEVKSRFWCFDLQVICASKAFQQKCSLVASSD